MTVYYNRNWGLIIIIASAIALALQLFNMSTGGRVSVASIAPVIGILFGFLYLKRPFFEVKNNEAIVLKALIGSATRVYEFDSKDQLSIDNGKVLLTVDGKSKKVPVSRFMSDKKDWQTFTRELELVETN